MRGNERVHFTGIGGAGMSAIAVVLLSRGLWVSGSDLKESRNTRRLEQMGARILIGHRPENVEGADILVVSSAISGKNSEIVRARELGLEVLPRAAMLDRIMQDGRGIAVAGTHGKTTTTSMIAMIMREAGLDPSYVVGGELNDVGSNAHAGSGEYVIAEADESDGSFLYLHPWAEVITNIEEDHLDFFRDGEEVLEYFSRFAALLPESGLLVICGDDPGSLAIRGCTGVREITFGESEGNDYRSVDVRLLPGGSLFKVYHGADCLGEARLNIPGMHNVRNAMAALALTVSIGVDFPTAARALEAFRGVQRRYQLVDEVEGIRIIDDYAHHPSEVMTTLEAASLEDAQRIVCIFQPHRYSRTAALHEGFARSLVLADLVIVTDVYAAGEEPLPGVNGKLIVNSLLEEEPAKQVIYLPKRSSLGKSAAHFVRPGDIVFTMGAGDITQSAAEIAAILREKSEDIRDIG